MRTTLRLLVLALVLLFAASCIYSRKKGGGTNINDGQGSNEGPWSGGGASPAFVPEPGR